MVIVRSGDSEGSGQGLERGQRQLKLQFGPCPAQQRRPHEHVFGRHSSEGPGAVRRVAAQLVEHLHGGRMGWDGVIGVDGVSGKANTRVK